MTTIDAMFAELARHDTPAGTITLRRRHDPTLQREVFEVKLGHEYLMSSAFTEGEEALARLGLDYWHGGPGSELGHHDGLAVVVGGMGLGYTAAAVLEDPQVTEVVVVEAVDQVLGWHRDGLLPDVAGLADDTRVRLVHGDFFAMAAADGLDPDQPGRQFDAILVDIDHTPRHHLHPSHADFYTGDGIRSMARFLRGDGVFGLWSDDPPEDAFTHVLAMVFDDTEDVTVDFANPLTGGRARNGVHLARGPLG